MRSGTWMTLTAVLMLFPLICAAEATVYRVGPGQKYSKVSDVAEKLRAGDVVEIVGDIVDSLTLTQSGTKEKPIVLRGVTRIEDGKIIRPRVIGTGIQPSGGVIVCKGNWNVIEGLDIQVDRNNLVERTSGNGLVQLDSGSADRAISSFDELVRKHPQHELSGKAEFLKGYVYLANQEYAQARDAFQRVVDLHTEDSYASKAEQYLDKLGNAGTKPRTTQPTR